MACKYAGTSYRGGAVAALVAFTHKQTLSLQEVPLGLALLPPQPPRPTVRLCQLAVAVPSLKPSLQRIEWD